LAHGQSIRARPVTRLTNHPFGGVETRFIQRFQGTGRGLRAIEDDPVVANAETMAGAATQGLHVALASQDVTVESRFHAITSVRGKGVEFLRGARREADCLRERYFASWRLRFKK
jgi:hypothetical protein